VVPVPKDEVPDSTLSSRHDPYCGSQVQEEQKDLARMYEDTHAGWTAEMVAAFDEEAVKLKAQNGDSGKGLDWAAAKSAFVKRWKAQHAAPGSEKQSSKPAKLAQPTQTKQTKPVKKAVLSAVKKAVIHRQPVIHLWQHPIVIVILVILGVLCLVALVFVVRKIGRGSKVSDEQEYDVRRRAERGTYGEEDSDDDSIIDEEENLLHNDPQY
jgi:hypothetical protein